jgi:calcium-binding protein CML
MLKHARTLASISSDWPCQFLTRAEVAKRFEEFDKDGDGFLSPQEVQSTINQLAVEVSNGKIVEDFWQADHDENGLVDYHEFMTHFMGYSQDEHDTLSGDDSLAYYGTSPFSSWDVLLEYCTIMKSSGAMGDKTRDAYIALIKEFKSLDLDGDGYLSEEELRAGVTRIHPESNESQIQNALTCIFLKADANQDGQIDFYEFASSFRPGFIQDIKIQ